MNKYIQKGVAFINKHGATIVAIAASGLAAYTTYRTLKTTDKARQKVTEAEELKGEPLTQKEEILAQAPAYIEPIVLTGATIALILWSNALNKKQQVALTAALLSLQQAYRQYKNKVVDEMGESFDNLIRREIAKDAVKDVPPWDDQEHQNEKLYYDEVCEEYFYADPETVMIGLYEINRQMQERGEATVNDYRGYMDRDWRPEFDRKGWLCDMIFDHWDNYWLYFDMVKEERDDGVEFVRIVPGVEPIYGYMDYPEWPDEKRFPFAYPAEPAGAHQELTVSKEEIEMEE